MVMNNSTYNQLTTNLELLFITNDSFNEWDSIFFDAVVANAILYRVLHQSHVITISGKSYRLKNHFPSSD